MFCPEQQRLLDNEVDTWEAYKAIREASMTEPSHETLDRVRSKAIVASNELRQHIQYCPVGKSLTK